MIERTQAFKTGDGNTFQSLDLAQAHELVLLFDSETPAPPLTHASAADMLVKHAKQVVDILTTTPTSKARARSVNGGTKTRVKKPETPIPSQFPKPSGDAITDRRRQEAAEAAK